MSFELENQTVVVTGAGRGIGLAIARRFTDLRARVSCWDVDVAGLSNEMGCEHATVADVTDPSSLQQAYRSTLDALGDVSVLVANAGINGPTKPIWDYSLEEWDQVMRVNLTGVFLCAQTVLPRMREKGYGRIVIIASVAAKEGNPGAVPYGASKAGVVGFAKGLARELLPSNITVNCVAPAMTQTDLLSNMSSDYIADKRSRIPMGRFCDADEIANMTAWAASPLCSFTTGQVFDVTGGRATY